MKLGPMPDYIRNAPHRTDPNAVWRNTWPPIGEVLWAAGFWEGEGSCQKGSVRAQQGHAEPLERLQYWFGGTVRRYQRRHWVWQCWVCGENARSFAEKIYPHLSDHRQRFSIKAS